MSTLCGERRGEAKIVELARKKEGSAMHTMNMKQNMTTHQPQRLQGVFAHPDYACMKMMKTCRIYQNK